VLGDHHGSTESFVESGTGAVTNASFTAFGARRNSATWSGDPSPTDRANLDALSRQGYTYQTVLGSMGFNHMNGRVQDAVTGRFLSADPFITEPNYTQNFNRYSYVYNNPLSLIDPSGFGDEPPPFKPPHMPRDTGGFPPPTCNGSTDMSACDSYMVEPCGNYGCSPYLGGGFAEAGSAAARAAAIDHQLSVSAWNPSSVVITAGQLAIPGYGYSLEADAYFRNGQLGWGTAYSALSLADMGLAVVTL
jgi:RHS repeat-associated protein